MKIKNDDIIIKRNNKNTKLSFDYYLPHNSGLFYDEIVGYRVIYGNEDYDNHTDFNSLSEAREFINQLDFFNKSFVVIRSIVFQSSFYLEDENGTVKDSNTNKLYTFINRSRFCEWDLDKIKHNSNLVLLA